MQIQLEARAQQTTEIIAGKLDLYFKSSSHKRHGNQTRGNYSCSARCASIEKAKETGRGDYRAGARLSRRSFCFCLIYKVRLSRQIGFVQAVEDFKEARSFFNPQSEIRNPKSTRECC
jgi:hypothetical protein